MMWQSAYHGSYHKISGIDKNDVWVILAFNEDE